MVDTPPLVEGTVEANGLRFGTLGAGTDGPLALCLHGFPDSAWTWQHLLPELAAAGYRAVAPFLRGYAPTEIPADGLYQPGALAADAIALHEALGGDGDAVLIGHDWGALATYGAAGHAPERWRRVVSAAVMPPAAVAQDFFGYDQLRLSWYMFFFQSPMAEAVVAADDLAFVDRLWADWSPGFDGAEFAARCKDALRDPANLAAAIAYYRATLGDGLRSSDLEPIEVAGLAPSGHPHLYLHGADDGCMGSHLLTDAVRTAFPHPDSQVLELEGCGHFLHLERPTEVNRLIIDFLTA
ncbi:MAG: alpha/beta hydrolase [Acidimicrobiales bacterium]|nr:alpha/beta hydrolase [Acidimicrobiales bacterium]